MASPSGEVVLAGTITDSASDGNGALAFADPASPYYFNGGGTAWIQMDQGSVNAAIISRWRISGPYAGGGNKEVYSPGIALQASNDATPFSSHTYILDVLKPRWLPRWYLTEFKLDDNSYNFSVGAGQNPTLVHNGTPYRAPRIANLNTYTQLGNCQIIARVPPVLQISSISGNGTTVTVHTAADHQLVTGLTVTIAGNSTAGYNGTAISVTVASPGGNVFTYSNATTGTPTTLGTVQGNIGNCQPDAPQISPWGGFYNGNANLPLVAFSDITTTPTLQYWYMTDGTTPTGGGGGTSIQYTGPFVPTISSGSSVTIKAVAYDTTCSTASSYVSTAIFNNVTYAEQTTNANYEITTGYPVDCHDPIVRGPWEGKYWMYGMPMNVGDAGADIFYYFGVNCYSSVDLLNWVFEGRVIDNAGAFALQRPNIYFNTNTGLYTCVAHWSSAGLAVNLADIWTAPHPQGPWTRRNTVDPATAGSIGGAYSDTSHGFKDCSVFFDASTGIPWALFTTQASGSNGDYSIVVQQMSNDGLSFTGNYQIVYPNGVPASEGPLIFKEGGVWFMCAGTATYYDSTVKVDPVYVTSTTTPLGTLSSSAAIFATDFYGQLSSAIKVNGQWAIWSDFWNKGASNQSNISTSGTIVSQITISGTTMSGTNPASWYFPTGVPVVGIGKRGITAI